MSGGPWTRWTRRTTGGAPLFPLGVLFGLNMVDELDRTAFGVLLPEIRDHFGLNLQDILAVVSLSGVAALLLALPVGFLADRVNRAPVAAGGAVVWATFSVLTGLAANVWVLGVARAGSGLGQAVNPPVHQSLLADYYDIPVRSRVYGVHRCANAAGMFAGPVATGVLAFWLGWRAPFVAFAFVTAVFVVLALRLREPVRGRHERQATGATDVVVHTEEQPPSWAESWRLLWQVRTMRRIYMALPFLAMSVLGLTTLSGLYYGEVFGLDERARGFLTGGVEGAASLIGLLVGIPATTKLAERDPGLVLRFMAVAASLVTAGWLVFALAPTLSVAVAANVFMSACGFVLAPGVYAVISQAVPAKVRAFGFAVATLWLLPGLLLLPVVGALADGHGIRTGLLAIAPLFLAFGVILASAGGFVSHDTAQVWKAAAARSEVALLRRRGQMKLLLARGIDVHYNGVQVLFGVDLEVDEGEIVALLGTNGAGKSTLLKALSGLVQPSSGAVVFDGRDMTHTPPEEVAGRGIAQVPGGQGTFTHLSVADNLRLAGWLRTRRSTDQDAATERVLAMFPVLRERLSEPAGNLSGGQQQMLALGMAFIRQPRLLLIDELSLGLAPAVVADLLRVIRLLKDGGTTVVLVEQSVNVALTVAERAYFMEKGEIRFAGPTRDLLERPDLLRSVFFSRQNGDDGHRPLRQREKPEVAIDADEPPALEVRNVVKAFGGIRALSDVSFDTHPGEIVGFIGPNGAGKTTLFDVIAGISPADAGTIRVRVGAQVSDLARMPMHLRARCGLGRSFQDGRLFGGLTVAETIAVALERHVDVRNPFAASLRLPAVADSEQKVRETVDELMELLGLGAYRAKFVRELSTGTRRIVDLACILAHRPALVLLDEPSSGIAQREAETLGPVLQRVRDQLEASLLVIEHDLPLLRSIADRMIALDLGRVIAAGQPEEVIDHPAVAGAYLGADSTAIARSGGFGPGLRPSIQRKP